MNVRFQDMKNLTFLWLVLILFPLKASEMSIKWVYECENNIIHPPVVDSLGNIYCAEESHFISIDSTGKFRWKDTLKGFYGHFRVTEPLIVDNRLYISDSYKLYNYIMKVT